MTVPVLREATPPDAAAIAEILFAGSYHDALRANVTPPLEDVETAKDLIATLLRVDPEGGVVAEVEGEPVAAGWVHVRGRVGTVGPLLVAPRWRGRDIGSTLLRTLLEQAGRGTAQVRMLDGGIDQAGLAVSLRAGLRVAAPMLAVALPAGHACLAGEVTEGTIVRAATADDVWVVVERDARSFGARRQADVEAALAAGRLLVGERAGRIVAHALAEVVGRTLVVGAVRTLVPAGDQRLVDLTLRTGFRVERLLAYLVRGGGTAPPKCYLPMPFGRC